MELIVAISISALLIFFIGKLFAEISDAVILGVNRGEIAANSNTISQELYDDFQNMEGPGDLPTGPPGDGFLIIVNHVLPNTAIRTVDRLREQHPPPPGPPQESNQFQRNVRSDQLVFIRKVDPDPTKPTAVEPLVAANSDSYSNSTTAQHTRIWYGHAVRTHPRGADTDTAGNSVGGLGQAGSSGSRLNYWGNEFILGRQVLFLKDPAAPSLSTRAVAPSGPAGNAALYYAPVTGGFAATPLPAPPHPRAIPAPLLLYMGLADVAKVKLTGLLPGQAKSAIIGANPGLTGYWLYEGQPDNPYHDRARSLAYPVERLRVNPGMEPGYRSRFHPWRVAQMHPYLMGNVSDFIIEFAADIVNDPPFVVFPDGEPDVDPSTGNLKWYTHPAFVTPNVSHPVPSGYGAHSVTHGLPSALNADASFVWRHDADTNPAATPWPYLIRVRYRLHDDRSILGEEKVLVNPTNPSLGWRSDPGIWFEQIIYVNRT